MTEAATRADRRRMDREARKAIKAGLPDPRNLVVALSGPHAGRLCVDELTGQPRPVTRAELTRLFLRFPHMRAEYDREGRARLAVSGIGEAG